MANQASPGPHGTGTATRRRITLGIVALVVLGLGASLGIAGCSSGPAAPAKAVRNPLTGLGTAGRVLAVKIDNVGSAQRGQTGLNSADVVYVIRVEGGLSRYLAVFSSTSRIPTRIGPVRSARQTDIPLLAAYGHVGLAYSGAISGLLPDLAKADLRTITPANAAKHFSNGGNDPTYISPAQIFASYKDLAQARDVGFRFGPAPADGHAATSLSVAMPDASFTFTASGARWLLSVDGHSATTTDQGRTNADNVIVQHVRIVPGKYTDHNAGHPDNEVFTQTTGQGAAEFYRDGKVWRGQWSKPGDTAPTSYTVNGAPMQLKPGRTWIILDGGS